MAHKLETYVQLTKNKCRCSQPIEAVKEVTHQGEEIVSQRIIAASCGKCGLKFIANDWRTGLGTEIIHQTKNFKP